jgi:hypothetical protein
MNALLHRHLHLGCGERLRSLFWGDPRPAYRIPRTRAQSEGDNRPRKEVTADDACGKSPKR